jgi:mannosyltransferase OCH1-like enzyme
VPEAIAFEFEMATEILKRLKSPGIDSITAELIKAGSKTFRSEIHKLINFIWNKEELPEQWKKYIIVCTCL